ncbi:MAG: 4Fe-4S binding protein [Clostridia bacterium]|nr:4Fe-4S binding protein [Clostridia bacterium]
MNAVLYFSCSGQSKAVANYLAEKFDFCAYDILNCTERNFKSAVIVFPVHCQTYPPILKNFFKELNAQYITLIATYGKASAGNAIFEAAKFFKNKVVAAAYIPAKHTYDFDERDSAPTVPDEVIQKIKAPSYVKIPRRAKNIFAGLFPAARSRAAIKIEKTADCQNCNDCGKRCPVGAMQCGKPTRKCVRCLKCVYRCPHGALKVKKSRILKAYLKRKRFDRVIIYV